MPVASWFEDMSDTQLKDLIPFFEKLSTVDNVYSVLKNTSNDRDSSCEVFNSTSLSTDCLSSSQQQQPPNDESIIASSPITSVPQPLSKFTSPKLPAYDESFRPSHLKDAFA